MNNPFFAVANRVLEMHTRCAMHMTIRNPARDIEWMTDRLNDLALMANYAGDFRSGEKIAEAARLWEQHGTVPALFIEDVSA